MALALASDWVAMLETCTEDQGRIQALVYAGNTLEVGGEMRLAAMQYGRAQQEARALGDADTSDWDQPFRRFEIEAATRRGGTLERLFEFTEALAAYHSVIDDPIFAESRDHSIREWYIDALVGALAIHHRLRDSRAFDQMLRRLRVEVARARAGLDAGPVPGDTARWEASVRAARGHSELLAVGEFVGATLAAERGHTRQAVRRLEGLVAAPDGDVFGTGRLLEARWRIFELRVDSGSRSSRALRERLLQAVLDEAARPIQSTSSQREYAARAWFRLVDERVADLATHVRLSRNITRAALERAIELADGVASAYAESLSEPWSVWGVRSVGRSADAYALVFRALDDTIPIAGPSAWQAEARARLTCNVVVLDRLALSHARVLGMDTEELATSIDRLALTPTEDIAACGATLPAAASSFPVVPFDPPPTAPLGRRLPPGQPVRVTPDLVQETPP